MNDRPVNIDDLRKGIERKPKSDREKKGAELLAYYRIKLAHSCDAFYKLVTEDEEANEELFKEHSMIWKKVANYANRTQKIIEVNPFAFEKQIEKYKEIAQRKTEEAREKKE